MTAARARPSCSSSRRVTQAILVEGRNRVRVYEPNGSPPEGFEPVAADPGGRLLRHDAVRQRPRRGRAVSPQRLLAVARLDLGQHLRRPMLWILCSWSWS